MKEARTKLVEAGGAVSQDLGAGRILGQVLVYLYLSEGACSLDDIGADLGLSKASVSIAARQLERLGLVKKIWRSGDRKSYFRSADNIGTALQQGLLSKVRSRVQLFGAELDGVLQIIDDKSNQGATDPEGDFLLSRVKRAKKLQSRLQMILGNPLLKLLEKI